MGKAITFLLSVLSMYLEYSVPSFGASSLKALGNMNVKLNVIRISAADSQLF